MGKIISISGKKQKGKNTVAKIWQLLDIWYNEWGDQDRVYFGGNPHEFVKKYLNEKYFAKQGQDYGMLEIEEYSSWETKAFATKLKQIGAILFGCKVSDFENEAFKNSHLPEVWTVYRIVPLSGAKPNVVYKPFRTKDEAQQEFNRLNHSEHVHKVEKWLPTYREFLQCMGTNLLRDQFNPAVWALALFSDYDPQNETNWIITDTRFLNECDIIEKNGGINNRVRRYVPGDNVLVFNKNSKKYEHSHEVYDVYLDTCCLIEEKTGEKLKLGFDQIREQTNVNEHISETELDDYDGFKYYVENHTDIGNLINEVEKIMNKENIIKKINNYETIH